MTNSVSAPSLLCPSYLAAFRDSVAGTFSSKSTVASTAPRISLPGRIRLLERKVDTIRHLIDTSMDPEARVNSLFGHISLHRAANTSVPLGSSATSSRRCLS